MPILTYTGGGTASSFVSAATSATPDPGFPTGLWGLLQQGFLARQMEEGLDSVLAYRAEAIREVLPTGIGETLTRTKMGRLAPVTTALNPTNNTNLDNGLSTVTFTIEQYQYTMQEYAASIDVNTVAELAGIASQIYAYSRDLGVQAAQSLERIAQSKLFNAYLGGNTYVTTTNGSTSTTQAYVDDIRGFQYVFVGGQLAAVSSSNTLTVQAIAGSSSGHTQTLTVTLAAADATNISTSPGGISGRLTYSSATAPVAGDSFIAATSPKILRPMGVTNTSLLQAEHTFTLSLVLDALAYLKRNAVPPMADGTYHCILDETANRQLIADQDFKIYYAGREQSEFFRDGYVNKLLGVTFIPTTEAYIQAPIGTGPNILRPIILGGGALLQGNFAGMQSFVQQNANVMYIEMINDVVHIVRPPLDRLGQIMAMSWQWTGDFAVPTDFTANTTIIPTASGSYYKRGIVLEIAG